MNRRSFLAFLAATPLLFLAGDDKMLPTENETIAKSLSDLAARVKTLETLQRMDLGTSIFGTRNFTVPTGVSTPVPFQAIHTNLGSGFTWDAGDPTKIYCKTARAETWAQLTGFMTWDINGVGRRGMNLVTFTALGAIRVIDGFNQISTISNLDATVVPNLNHNVPFCTVQRIVDPTDYFSIYVDQTSGGNLLLGFLRAAFSVVR